MKSPRTRLVIGRTIAFILAAIFTVMALGQLFSFSKLPLLFESYLLPFPETSGRLVAALLPVLEIFSLPFLLNMKVSATMRVLSRYANWLLSLLWLFLGVWLVATVNNVTASGLLGVTPHIPAGHIPLIAGIIFMILELLLIIFTRSTKYRDE